jgi:predicted O-linked N-acetylglucosamine transferase (SPINDLY family)
MAVDLIGRALAADPLQPAARANLATVLRAAGRLTESALAAAAASALAPDYAAGHVARGLAEGDLGAGAAAQAAFAGALALDPGNASARANLGAVLLDQGKPAEAERELRAALTTDPGLADARANLGNALRDQGRLDQAIAAYHEALRLAPGAAMTLANLGVALLRRGERAAAAAALRQAVRARPDLAIAHASLGHVYNLLGKQAEAEAACRRALSLAPAHTEGWFNLGVVRRDQGRNDAAETAFTAVIASRPGLAVAHANLGVLQREALRLDDALAAFDRAADLDPSFADADSNALVTMLYMDRFSAAEVSAEHVRRGRRHEARIHDRLRPHDNVPDPERRLRIGYLAPQLRAHALAPAMLPVFEHHRHDLFSIHVFAHVPNPDEMTARMKGLVDEWTFIHELGDDRAAERVRSSAIDILVHPMGHWADSRFMVLALKPAPVQVAYICNAPTMGLAAVEYAVIDRWLDHDGALAALMTETPVHLPGGFQVHVYDVQPATVPPPCLAHGRVTFGSFNNPAKISDAAIRLWAAVLAAVPDARLLLKGRGLDRPTLGDGLRRRFAAAGLAPERIELRDVVADATAHLASYGDVDIALDTLPFTGGRTTLDALWMGVPVVTRRGAALYGRYSAGHLDRIGLPELIAADDADFVAIAAALARAPDRLAAYRGRLRTLMQASTLMDGRRHVGELEDAYRRMWRRWCAGRDAPGGDETSSVTGSETA